MIYLTTGANGAGKTLITLADVRKAQLSAPDRPVYYHGFVPKAPIHEFGWLPFEPAKWQDLPDGSICVFDEAQNEFPSTMRGELPDWINAIAQHRRRRGFDFWVLTPHPTMLHNSVRKLIESPSWHRHVKRVFGTDNASIATYNYAETRCELPSAGARGQVEVRAYPKEVYNWYESAVKHTGKKRIPKQVYVLLVALVLLPVLAWFVWSSLSGRAEKLGAPAPGSAAGQVSNMPAVATAEPMSAEQYAASFSPRFPGFAHTAPRYDEVTRPTVAPYPAACVATARGCRCYTQQATRLTVPEDTCREIVAGGFFIDWEQQAAKGEQRGASVGPSSPSAVEPLLTRNPADVGQPPRASAPGSVSDGATIAAMRSPA